jgi:predicted GIY-YIG superfamily endonuclease
MVLRCHEQLLVLVSRVRTFQDLYFVGDGDPQQIREATFNAMRAVINRNSPFTGYVSEMLKRINYLDGKKLSIQVRLPAFPYIHREIPPALGYVYMIVSQKNPHLGYVGETKDFKRRLLEHNSEMGGCVQTRADKPWLPVVLITGFDDPSGDYTNEWLRKEFERRWREENNRDAFKATNSVIMRRNGETILGDFKNMRGVPLLPDLNWLKLAELTENGNNLDSWVSLLTCCMECKLRCFPLS